MESAHYVVLNSQSICLSILCKMRCQHDVILAQPIYASNGISTAKVTCRPPTQIFMPLETLSFARMS